MESLKYTNYFTVISNDEQNELIVTFYQSVPEINEDGTVVSIHKTELGSFIMNREMAAKISGTMNEILSKDNNTK